jgi:hypothetical protein
MTEHESLISSKNSEFFALSGMINTPENLEIGCTQLSSADFHFEENREIFKAIKHLKNQNNEFEFFNLEERIKAFLQHKGINGFDYPRHIDALSLYAPGVDMPSYIKTLKDFSAKRKLLESHRDILNDIQRGKTFSDIVERQKKNFDEIEQGLVRDDKFRIKCIADLGANWLYETPTPKKMLLEYGEKENRNGFIPKGNVCMLVGMGGIGKSHFVSQLAASIATGTLFLDTFTPTKDCGEGNVFLGLAENDLDDIKRMLHKATQYLRKTTEPNLKLEQIKSALEHKIFPYSFHGQQCQFIHDGAPSPYFHELKRHLIKNAPKGGWALIVLDPISRFLGAEAETDNAAATAFIALMEQLSMELPGNPTILFCHHMNKSAISGNASGQEASRGSSAITDGVRLQINLRRITDKDSKVITPDQIVMTMAKSNHTRYLEDITLIQKSDGYLSKAPQPLQRTAREEKPAAPRGHKH